MWVVACCTFVTVMIAVGVDALGLGNSLEAAIPTWVGYVFLLPALLIIALTLSAIWRMVQYGHWMWLLLTLFTAFIGAFAYGLIAVDTSANTDELTT